LSENPYFLGSILLPFASNYAFHRFAEVSVGIAVALLFATVWPEEDAAAAN
jgi:uncharacterized membrane protein YccC